jgi:hypothetical protein
MFHPETKPGHGKSFIVSNRLERGQLFRGIRVFNPFMEKLELTTLLPRKS